MQQYVILTSVIFIFLTACAPKRVVFEPMQPSAEKGSLVYVYRSLVMANAMTSPIVLLNGELVSKLESNSYLHRYVMPGRHVLSLDLGERYTGNKKIDLNVKPNTAYFVRMTSELRFEMNKPYTRIFNLELVNSIVALSEMADISADVKSKSSSKEIEVVADVKTDGTEDAGFSIENTRNPFAK